LVARTLLLVRRHREEQQLDAAIVPVAGSFLSSSAAVACWVTNGELTLRFGINLSNQGDLLYCLTPCAGCVPLIMFRKHGGQLFSRTPYSVFHTDRPIIAKYNIIERRRRETRAAWSVSSSHVGRHGRPSSDDRTALWSRAHAAEKKERKYHASFGALKVSDCKNFKANYPGKAANYPIESMADSYTPLKIKGELKYAFLFANSAHCPTGATYGGTGGDIFILTTYGHKNVSVLCARATSLELLGY
jgi:hypothetical protein